MRIISMKKVREVLRLHLMMQLSPRKIKGATGVARTTVQDYIKRCDETGITIDELDAINDDTLQLKLFGEQKASTIKSTKVMPDYDYVHTELKQAKKTKVTLTFLWEAYKSEYGDRAYEYTQYRVYYRRYKQKLNPSMRQVHIAGEKVFVDYSGVTVPIHNQKTGEVDNAQVFVAVLGASGYTFVHVTHSQKQEDFILSHVLAYEFFGGTPRIVVPDNLKSAVISNNKNGIVINESYAALARHYGMMAEPARPRKPRDKPKAEQGVQAIQRWILAHFRHHRFFSVDEANEYISELLDIYNNKVMKHLGKSRRELFEALDAPQLKALPANRHTYTRFKVARVDQHYHIALEKCNYSVPFKYLRELVDIRYSVHSVQIYFKNELIATHPRLRTIGQYSTLTEHMPKAHEYIHEKMNPARLRSWAKNIGEYSTIFVEDALSAVEHQPQAYKWIVAVLSLSRIYGEAELEPALMYAIEKRTIKTKSIKSILEKKLYLQKSANNANHTGKMPVDDHGNIRGPENYK
jgi:transposase